jgi:hypothetical protein
MISEQIFCFDILDKLNEIIKSINELFIKKLLFNKSYHELN